MQDVDECASSPCSADCDNSPGGFACACPDGFNLNREDMSTCNEYMAVNAEPVASLVPATGVAAVVSFSFPLPWRPVYLDPMNNLTKELSSSLTQQLLSTTSGVSSLKKATLKQLRNGSIIADFVLEIDGTLSSDDVVRTVLDVSSSVLNGDFIIDSQSVSPTLAGEIAVRLPNGNVTNVPANVIQSDPCDVFNLLDVCKHGESCVLVSGSSPLCIHEASTQTSPWQVGLYVAVPVVLIPTVIVVFLFMWGKLRGRRTMDRSPQHGSRRERRRRTRHYRRKRTSPRQMARPAGTQGATSVFLEDAYRAQNQRMRDGRDRRASPANRLQMPRFQGNQFGSNPSLSGSGFRVRSESAWYGFATMGDLTPDPRNMALRYNRRRSDQQDTTIQGYLQMH